MDKFSRVTGKGSNVVILSGWLIIDNVWEVTLKGRVENALQVCVLTKRPPSNIKHITKKHLRYGFPALLTGEPAKIVLDWAHHKEVPPRVVVEGKLRKMPEIESNNMLVHVKYLDIMNLDGGNGNSG